MDTVELRQRRASLWEQAKSLHALADKEHRQLTAEEKQQWDKINLDIDGLKETIDREERIAAIDKQMAETPDPVSKPKAEIREIHQGKNVQKFVDDEDENPLPDDPEYRAAFRAYLRDGLGGMRPDLRAVLQPHYGAVTSKRALGTTSDAVGGALVPQSFYATMLEAMKAFGGMRQAPTTKLSTATGATMPIPLADDTDNTGEQLGENSATGTTGTDPKFASKDLEAYIYSSKMVRVSLVMLQDSAFPMETWLASALGKRLGRITNSKYTTGSGSSEPEGIMTAAGAGVTGATLTDWTELVALEHSVDPSYRAANCGYMFHDTTLSLLKQMKDGNDRPLWLPGLTVGEPDRILRYPYWINQDMAEADAGAKAMAFGDWSYYFIRDVQDIRILRLEERFAEYLQVGFLAFLRSDGVFATPSDVTNTISDPNTNVPVKYLEMSASL